MAQPRVLILRAPGANCDLEAEFAFQRAGAIAERLHIQRLRDNPKLLLQYQIMTIPGGFSYGDDVAAGKILAVQLQHFLGDVLRAFRDKERLILGICNGFQALLKAGLIVPPDLDDGPIASLAHNTSGKFEDRWIHLEAHPGKCPFLMGCQRLHLPIAHGEGNFICTKEWILKGLFQAGQVVLRYAKGPEMRDDRRGTPTLESSPFAPLASPLPYPINPNGSQGDIAGVCDPTGRVLGLMPHPERHVLPTQHPQWTRLGLAPEGDGMQIFRNAVEYFK